MAAYRSQMSAESSKIISAKVSVSMDSSIAGTGSTEYARPSSSSSCSSFTAATFPMLSFLLPTIAPVLLKVVFVAVVVLVAVLSSRDPTIYSTLLSAKLAVSLTSRCFESSRISLRTSNDVSSAIAPSASAHSCLVIPCSLWFFSTEIRVAVAAFARICPSANATSCLNNASACNDESGTALF